MMDHHYKCPARGCNESFSKRSSWAGHCMAHVRKGELIVIKPPIREGELIRSVLIFKRPSK